MNHAPTNIRIGMAQSRNEAGFTLLEIIVVTAIIGIMATMLVGALIQDNDRIARLEAQRFVSVVTELRDEAVLLGTPLLLSFSSNGYETSNALTSTGKRGGNSLLRERRVQDGVSIEAQVFALDDDSSIEPNFQLSPDPELEQEQDEDLAQNPIRSSNNVLIDTLGELTQFEARFGGDELEYLVFINDDGELAIEVKDL